MRDVLSDGIRWVGSGCGGLEGRSQEGRASPRLHTAGGRPKVMPSCEVRVRVRNAHQGGGEGVLAAGGAGAGSSGGRSVSVQIPAVECVSSPRRCFQIRLTAVKKLI